MPSLNPVAVSAMMERLMAGIGSDKRGDEQCAQDLIYQAMEAQTLACALPLLNQALELDPENVDALLMLCDAADAAGSDADDRVERLQGIVASGAKKLGKKAFKELVPHFWGFIETRPYMRARERLAEALRSEGRLEEAVAEYNGMLVLNPGDNQGVRYHLLSCLLALGHLEAAEALMEQFDECDWSVVFAWGRVLERYLSGDEADAKNALVVARKQNPHMEAYLNGRLKLPKNLPCSYSTGSREEAICFAGPLLMAWAPHPAALAWLKSQSKSSGKSAK